jgi:DNA-binding XRE family transcriptional regulator
MACDTLANRLIFWALLWLAPNIMSKFEIPMEVSERVARLGQRIRLARIRRGWSVADLANKAGINRNTLTALELGKPGTAVGVCFTVLWALGLDKSLDAVADPDADLHGKALEASRRPTRAGKPRKVSDDYDF